MKLKNKKREMKWKWKFTQFWRSTVVNSIFSVFHWTCEGVGKSLFFNSDIFLLIGAIFSRASRVQLWKNNTRRKVTRENCFSLWRAASFPFRLHYLDFRLQFFILCRLRWTTTKFSHFHGRCFHFSYLARKKLNGTMNNDYKVGVKNGKFLVSFALAFSWL